MLKKSDPEADSKAILRGFDGCLKQGYSGNQREGGLGEPGGLGHTARLFLNYAILCRGTARRGLGEPPGLGHIARFLRTLAGGLGEPPGLGHTARPLKLDSKNPSRHSIVREKAML